MSFTDKRNLIMAWLTVACMVGLTAMRITVSMPSTGIAYVPGLAKAAVIEVDQLPKELANELRDLAERAGIFDRVDMLSIGGTKDVRDARQTTITVEQGDKRRIIQLSDPVPEISNEPLREFTRRVTDQARLARQQTIKKGSD
jgi:hypothetical protein